MQAQRSKPLRIQLSESSAGAVFAKLAGEFDMEAETLFAETVTRGVVRNGHATVALDCSEVTFIDSSGLRALIDAQKQAELCGSSFVLLAPSDVMSRVLELAGLLDHFAIVTDDGYLGG